jgi:hypothetical protein
MPSVSIRDEIPAELRSRQDGPNWRLILPRNTDSCHVFLGTPFSSDCHHFSKLASDESQDYCAKIQCRHSRTRSEGQSFGQSAEFQSGQSGAHAARYRATLEGALRNVKEEDTEGCQEQEIRTNEGEIGRVHLWQGLASDDDNGSK